MAPRLNAPAISLRRVFPADLQMSRPAGPFPIMAGAAVFSSVSLLVLWRRVFRAKPPRVRGEELAASRSKAITLEDGTSPVPPLARIQP
jgi:hypothetical protein